MGRYSDSVILWGMGREMAAQVRRSVADRRRLKLPSFFEEETSNFRAGQINVFAAIFPEAIVTAISFLSHGHMLVEEGTRTKEAWGRQNKRRKNETTVSFLHVLVPTATHTQ